jgi:Fe2+ or Zn2+ uptake regulation protein
MKQEIARKKGFEVTGAEVQVTGYCPRCRRKKK